MINEKVFQSIYDELSKYLSSNWEKLVVYLEYGEASYTFAFYEKLKDAYVKCFDIPGVSEEKLMKSFSKLAKMISKERGKKGQEVWSTMTMVVTSDGRMHTDYDYTDLSEGSYQYMKNWKKKYLV